MRTANKFADEGAHAIADALRINTGVKRIDLRCE